MCCSDTNFYTEQLIRDAIPFVDELRAIREDMQMPAKDMIDWLVEAKEII